MNEPEVKFTKRRDDDLEQYRDSARRIDGGKVQFILHILLRKKTNDIVREIDDWIRQGQGEDGPHFGPETRPRRVLLMGMMNEIPICSKESKGGKALFLQDAERNAAYFARFKPGCLCTQVDTQKKTLEL